MGEPPRGTDDPFEGLTLDDAFVRGGRYEPPARTRSALARLEGRETSWRQGASPGAEAEKARRLRGSAPRGRVSLIFVGLVAVLAGSLAAAWETQTRYAVFVAVVAGWLVSLCLHEFAHAAVAHAGGDHSVAIKGYLRLDIRRYAHPFLSFALPVLFVLLGGIGLPGGAVWIDQAALRSRRARSLTSLAGPAANVACAAVCLVPLAFVSDVDAHRHFWAALAFLGFLQVSAVVINMLPVPGLDGWGVIEPYLPHAAVRVGRALAPFGTLLLFFVLFRSAAVSGSLGRLLTHVVTLTGVPAWLPGLGYALFRFWS